MKQAVVFIGTALSLMAGAAPSHAVDLGDGLVRLRHVTYPARPQAVQAPSLTANAVPSGVHTWIVAFEGPADGALREGLAEADVNIVGYVPSRAYLVRGSAAAAQAATATDGVLRVDYVQPEWRVAPELAAIVAEDPRLFLDIYPGEDVARAADRVRALGVEVLRADQVPGLSRLLVRADASRAAALASLSEVAWVEGMPQVTLRNDNVRWVIQSNDGIGQATPLHDRGLFGAGQILGHIDTAPSLNHCFFLDPVDNQPGPLHRKVVGYRTTSGPGPHGAHTAGTLCGEDPASPANRGMAPKARLSHANSASLDGLDWNGFPSNLFTMLGDSHADGARIHSNSWGDDRWRTYTDWCVDIDTFSRMQEEDLIVFAVSNNTLLKTPENAKNCLAVGATMAAASAGTIWRGGTGPTTDGRRKPEVYAPGRNTLSAGLTTCGLVLSSGTSMACPAVAGGAALIREYFQRGFHPTGRPWIVNGFTPTGALLKAMVVNSTTDMSGHVGYPGLREGWGRLLLDNGLYFQGDTRRLWLRDVRHAEGLATGGVREWSVVVASSSEPLAVTMTFMDQPAVQLAVATPVNDIDLEVVGPDGFFRGNRFDTNAGVSLAGGNADLLNNVERVILAAPTAGRWTIRVRGTSVPMGPQGFAVVVNGALSRRQFTSHPVVTNPRDLQEEEDDPEAGWRLDAVRPTPFRTQASVVYSMPERSQVAIRVYDVTGRRVRVLLDRAVDAGEHGVTWDGRDDAGALVGPGIYLLRLTAPGIERTVRSVFLR